jgi:hypothetical protein
MSADIVTVHNPQIYTQHQLEYACAIHDELGRGTLILTDRPVHDCDSVLGLGACDYCTWQRKTRADKA